MSLLWSPPDGLAQIGWRRIGLTALAFCLVPAVLGAAIVLLTRVTGPRLLGQDHLWVEGVATLAMISPLVMAPIWAIVAFATAALLRLGRYGWLATATLGLLAFLPMARTEVGTICLPFGATAVLLYRMALALQRPEAI